MISKTLQDLKTIRPKYPRCTEIYLWGPIPKDPDIMYTASRYEYDVRSSMLWNMKINEACHLWTTWYSKVLVGADEQGHNLIINVSSMSIYWTQCQAGQTVHPDD